MNVSFGLNQHIFHILNSRNYDVTLYNYIIYVVHYSEFMVNAMDATELRQSLRRARRWGGASDPPPASLSGSPHDSDDDEVRGKIRRRRERGDLLARLNNCRGLCIGKARGV